MPIVGGLDIHRKQLTFDYLDTVSGQVTRSQVASADREHLRAWLARLAGRGDAAFAIEGCTGWRYVAGELAAAGVGVHLAEPPALPSPAAASGAGQPGRRAAPHPDGFFAPARLALRRSGLGHDLEVRVVPQERLETLADDFIIVDDQGPHRASPDRSGRLAATTSPASDPLAISKLPPLVVTTCRRW